MLSADGLVTAWQCYSPVSSHNIASTHLHDRRNRRRLPALGGARRTRHGYRRRVIVESRSAWMIRDSAWATGRVTLEGATVMRAHRERAVDTPQPPVWRLRASALVLLGSALVTGAFVGGTPDASATPLPTAVEAWIYPGSVGQATCDVPAELSALASDPIALLKPEYLTVKGNGKLGIETATDLPCNGFSSANLAEVRAAAHQVFVTVSASSPATKSLSATPSKMSAALEATESFVASNGLNGVDLDFEPNDWTDRDVAQIYELRGRPGGCAGPGGARCRGRPRALHHDPWTPSATQTSPRPAPTSSSWPTTMSTTRHALPSRRTVASAGSCLRSEPGPRSRSHRRSPVVRLHDDNLHSSQARYLERALRDHGERARIPAHPCRRREPA